VAQWVQGRRWQVLGITPSPITGPEGNIEFLLAAQKQRAAEFPPPPPQSGD